MTEQIPAGKVLQNIVNAFKDKEFNIKELKESLESEFKEKINEIKFVNCSGAEFNFSKLLEFLVSKGKLLANEDMYSLNPEFVCSCD